MWFLDKSDPRDDDGAAPGGRAALIIGICFLLACIVQAAVTVATNTETPELLERAEHQAATY